MTLLLDTDVVIHIRDGNAWVTDWLTNTSDRIAISLVTIIELHAGLVTEPAKREQRRLGMAMIAGRFRVAKLDDRVVGAYGAIIDRAGYSRVRVLDRLIAATAIVNGLKLITMNGADFRDIPDLKFEVWPTPPQ